MQLYGKSCKHALHTTPICTAQQVGSVVSSSSSIDTRAGPTTSLLHDGCMQSGVPLLQVLQYALVGFLLQLLPHLLPAEVVHKALSQLLQEYLLTYGCIADKRMQICTARTAHNINCDRSAQPQCKAPTRRSRKGKAAAICIWHGLLSKPLTPLHATDATFRVGPCTTRLSPHLHPPAH